MSSLRNNSKVLQLGVRYFMYKNILILGQKAIGMFFIAIENYKIQMFQLESINYRRAFSHNVKLVKDFDRKKEVWVAPRFPETKEVSPGWFAKKATFIQCEKPE